MSAILIFSILMRLIALVVALVLWRRLRDWRMIFVALMIGLMALRQILTLGRQGFSFEISFTAAPHELPGLIVSFLALASVFFLQKILRDRTQLVSTLERTTTRLSNILNHSADAIIVIDKQGRIETFNHSAEILFGYGSEEMQGQNVNVLMPEPDHGGHDGYIKDYLRCGTGKILGIGPRELTARRKDGTEIPVELSVGEMRLGQEKNFIGILRDISLRKADQAKLEQAQRLELIGNLTGSVAHDFNNLLQVIIGNLEFLGASLEAGSQPHKFQEVALRASLRGADLTQRLLAYSRRQTLKPEATNINGLFSSITDLITSALGEDIEIETHLAEDLWPARIDPAQLEVATLNLAVNARHAMPNGGKLVIETANFRAYSESTGTGSELEPGSYVMLAMTDTGTGMPPEVVRHAFDPFFSTKDIDQGNGLGLSMVYGFAKQSGGHAEIHSTVGQGTTIKLYLPRSSEADSVGSTQGNSEAVSTGSETILVVEDNPDVRAFVVGLLESLGYDVLEAPDGPSAIRHIQRSANIDLLLTDVVMPRGMNGHELAYEFKQHSLNGAVLLTSGHQKSINQTVLHNSTFPLLTKPFTRAQLAKQVRDILDDRCVVS